MIRYRNAGNGRHSAMSNRRHPAIDKSRRPGRNPDLPHQSGCVRPSYIANRGYHMRLFMLMIPTLERLGAAMANILFLIFCIDILLYAASQFNGRGQAWADLVCTYSYGACSHPQTLLLIIIPLFIATFLAHKNRQM